MSDLSRIERLKLEKLFDMASGYVMEFSNRTFSEFIFEVTRIEIYNDKYSEAGDSKAKRMRAFWDKENNYVVGKLILSMLEHWRTDRLLKYREIKKPEQDLFDECVKIGTRLKADKIIEEIEVIKEDVDDRDIALLAKSIRESIEKNEPEVALDRLHTYVVKYCRQLCEHHNIEIKKDESLNSVFGKYVGHIVKTGKIESLMGERILKYSIHVIDAFNDIRNNKSFAHDNPILNYHESVLIFNNVTNALKFIDSIEEELNSEKADVSVETNKWEDLPF